MKNNTSKYDLLVHAIKHMEHVLPGQAPIRDFVHHNTIHGFQHFSFEQAVIEARKITGNHGYESLENFRNYFNNGRINLADLNRVLDKEQNLTVNAIVYSDDNYCVTARDLYLLGLCQSIPLYSRNQLAWQIEEHRVLDRFNSAISNDKRSQLLQRSNKNEKEALNELWAACIDQLQLDHTNLHPEELIELSAEHAEQIIQQMIVYVEDELDASILDVYTEQQADRFLTEIITNFGTSKTIRDIIRDITGKDFLYDLQQYLIRLISAYLDQGSSAWSLPNKELGLLQAWKTLVQYDPQFNLHGIDSMAAEIAELGDDAFAIMELELQRLGLPVDKWERYLTLLALEIPGWSGMLHWYTRRTDKDQEASNHFADYLAIRLVLDRIFAQQITRELWQIDISIDVLRWYFKSNKAEFIVRYLSQTSHLPEYLHHQLERLIDHSDLESLSNADWQSLANLLWTWRMSKAAEMTPGYQLTQHAWPLFLIMQHLSIDGHTLMKWSQGQLDMLFKCIKEMQSEQGQFIWLRAYENHYRDLIFSAIIQNEQRGAWYESDSTPQAQVIFCIDEREEGFRRHLEAINPDIQTFGAAGFFAVAIDWKGLDDTGVTPLCPIVAIPEHEVHELPAQGQQDTEQSHKARRALRTNLKQLFLIHSRRNLFTTPLLISLAAPFGLLSLLAKAFIPTGWSSIMQAVSKRFDKPVTTRLKIHTTDKTVKGLYKQLGFTDEEMASRVAGFLKSIGLIDNFSGLIVLMGHGSSSVNNPHLAAYDCGACSGRHGGPNARTFASMANRPEVRELLTKQGLYIPEDTWFIGAEHNTGNEQILWYDADLIPVALQPTYQKLTNNLTDAQQHSAHERSRRLASAPKVADRRIALRHVIYRGNDISQARPELGHATNAAAIIGRRNLSCGVFFDRRTFLISYDPCTDPDGTILENILLAVGPVGAGINLEYYFSTVDNIGYGCGSKISHNVIGNLGIMDGTRSDLRTGLPKQMTEIHEAMRLQVIVESKLDIVTRIYQRKAEIQELVGNGWLLLSVKDFEDGSIHVFDPINGFTRWKSDLPALPNIEKSVDWYNGHSGPLTPALLKKPGGQHA